MLDSDEKKRDWEKDFTSAKAFCKKYGILYNNDYLKNENKNEIINKEYSIFLMFTDGDELTCYILKESKEDYIKDEDYIYGISLDLYDLKTNLETELETLYKCNFQIENPKFPLYKIDNSSQCV
jgi:hypothetical protein